MSSGSIDSRSVVDCRHLRTRREAFAVFRHWASPRVIVTGIAMVTAIRILVGEWSWWDLLAVGIVLALTPFTEWVIHLHLLHGDPVTIRGVTLDNGIGHRQHHGDPSRVEFILLRGIDAAVFQPMIAALVVSVTVPAMWLAGAPIVAPTITAVLAAFLKLLEYEWDHFFFHTACRPRTRWYRRLKRNHRLHHWRNEHYWLGVTVNLGDRMLRTYPKHKTDVPLSPTARTLDADPEAQPG